MPPEPDDLHALGQRIERAREGDSKRGNEPPPGALGIAFRFATELGSALLVGAGLGWLLDRWLHTTPILSLILGVLGFAAGLWDILRQLAKEERRESGNGG